MIEIVTDNSIAGVTSSVPIYARRPDHLGDNFTEKSTSSKLDVLLEPPVWVSCLHKGDVTIEHKHLTSKFLFFGAS